MTVSAQQAPKLVWTYDVTELTTFGLILRSYCSDHGLDPNGCLLQDKQGRSFVLEEV